VACEKSRSPGPFTVNDLARVASQCAATRSGFEYRASIVQWHADHGAQRPKAAKIAANA